ncbi:MAG: hypothetical protein ACREUA_06490, partial [Burkholderiales bacterium]
MSLCSLIKRITAITTLVASFVPYAVAEQHDAAVVVEGFQQVLLSTMKNASQLGYSGRYEQLAPAVQA